jgi:hypothetical protein
MGEQSAAREARLRPEFAAEYPYLTPGVWESAAVLADRVMAHHLRRPSARFVSKARALDPAHFEFRRSEQRVGVVRAVRDLRRMVERQLFTCYGGPWDGRRITDRGPTITVTTSVMADGALVRPRVEGLYERRKDGYHWVPASAP